MSMFNDLTNIKETTIDVSERPSNYISFVMDHSGSMADVAEVSRKNFNEQLEQIKIDSSEHNNYITIIEFDSTIKERCVNKDINEVKKLYNYWIGGMTALYDAVMWAISRIQVSMIEDDNSAALVVIITDGFENASVENKGDEGRLRLKKRIEMLQKTGKWTFVFMGADQNLLDTAVEGLGIHIGNTMSYNNNDDGVNNSYKTFGTSYKSFSSSRKLGNTNSVNFFGGSSTNGNE